MSPGKNGTEKEATCPKAEPVRTSRVTREKLKSFFERKTKESGAVVLLFAITLMVSIGFLGLVIDLGFAYFVKRHMQTAADASAFAGAHTLQRWDHDKIVVHALEEAASNGFDGSRGETRIVNRPPQTGDFAGDSNFVEVIITQELPTFFMGVFDSEFSELTVSSRAVAGVIPEGGCIYVLDGDDDKAFEVSSGSAVHALECSVIVHSCDKEALHVTSGSILDASKIDVCGKYEDGGGTIEPEPSTGVCAGNRCDRGPDPLSEVPAPDGSGSCSEVDFKVNSRGSPSNRYVIDPGIYCNGISVESGSHVFFTPGIYILRGGGLQIESGSTAEGFNVGFYNTEGSGYDYKPININSGTEAWFTAPTAQSLGEYRNGMEGMLFFQDRNIEGDYDNKIESNAGAWYEGTMYFPTQHLMLHSNTLGESGASWSVIVVNTFEVSSGTGLIVESKLPGSNGAPMEVTLVE